MARGNMRRIVKKYNKARGHMMGHSWVMDTAMTFGRSEEGCKYLIVLRDRASAFIQLISLKYKSDATQEASKWIKGLQANDLYRRLGYSSLKN